MTNQRSSGRTSSRGVPPRSHRPRTIYPPNPRPTRPLGRQGAGGILLEVERGKALANNMDLLDLWKCHICHEAHHLFLVVPFQVRRSYGVERVYEPVLRRMKTFVEPSNKVNVATISVFGY